MLYTGTPGNDTFAGGSDNDTANGNGGNDTLLGGVGNDVITGDDGHDSLAGEWGNDSLSGGDGLDKLDGGFGDDVLSDSDGGSSMNGGDGFDSLSGGSGADVLNGGANADSLAGAGGSDVLTDGDAGNSDADTLVGGSGDDVLISRGGADTVDGGDGIDSLILDRTAAASGLLFDLAQMATVSGVTLADGTRIAQVEMAEIRSGSGDDTLLGAAAADRLLGGAGHDSLSGNSGHDRLDGEDGNDLLLGGGGGDTLTGGAGNDTVSYDNAGGSVVVDLTASAAQNTGGGGNDQISQVEHLTGSSFNDILIGDAGGNRLDGGGGKDILVGGAGDDTYVVDHAEDIIQEGNNGVDTVLASVTWTLGGGLEYLTLTGSGHINATGNGLNNLLSGNGGNNLIDGGTGNDIMIGGLGDDTYIVNAVGDNVSEAHLAGTDTIRSSVTYSLFGRAVEYLTLTGSAHINAAGNGLNNLLTGNSGNNLLDGGGGHDIMIGGLGDDTYVVDAVGEIIAENHFEGTDTLRTSVTYSLFGRAIEIVEMTGSGHIGITGNSLANTVTGNSGNNSLDGGVGNDTLAGGAGNDTYFVDAAGDSVVESGVGGTDLIVATVTRSLVGGNAENLTLTGVANIHATGNGAHNVLTGNTGNNSLDGGAGNDTLYGGGGNDSYYVDSSSDRVSDSTGTDLILSSVTYNLTKTGVESLTLTGSANINGTGNSLDNTLTGNAGSNALNGGVGDDTMTGGAGDDSYYLLGNDVIVETAGGGFDTLFLGATKTPYTLSEGEIEAVSLTGSAGISLTGNSLDNRLTGNSANNLIYGVNGNDTLVGGGGFDQVYGGAGNDSLEGAGRLDGGEGNDTMTGLGTFVVDSAGDVVVATDLWPTNIVLSSASYVLTTPNLSYLFLTGTGNINATGNFRDNEIKGNDGNNVLDGGSAGLDTLRGGLGDDTYYVKGNVAKVYEGAGEGRDLIVSSDSFDMSYNAVESLILTGSATVGWGNALDNTITGNAGHNELDGGAGADTLVGGQGNDSYRLDSLSDVVVEAAGEGSDQVYANFSYTLGATLEHLRLYGTAALEGTGNALNNVIYGNLGANRLDGGAGDDTLWGNTGNDTYIVDSAGDLAIEAISNSSVDTVLSSATFTLRDELEHLTLTGSDAIDGTGNNRSNIITGNAGINGLKGGGGHDTYFIQTVGDTVLDEGGGNDHVNSTISFNLTGTGVEWLHLDGANAISGTGDSGDNYVFGGDGNNLIDGGSGRDILGGGLGDDTIVIDSHNDEAQGNAGIDTLRSSTNVSMNPDVTLLFDFEIIELTGSEDLRVNASEGTESIYGNSGNNRLTGNGGDDRLDGGSANDTLLGGDGADLFVFGLNSDKDELDDFIGSDGDRIDISAFTGGNSNPALVSQSGADVLIDFGDGKSVLILTDIVDNVVPYIVW